MALKEFFDTFDNVEKISEIIILGEEGGVRRVVRMIIPEKQVRR